MAPVQSHRRTTAWTQRLRSGRSRRADVGNNDNSEDMAAAAALVLSSGSANTTATNEEPEDCKPPAKKRRITRRRQAVAGRSRLDCVPSMDTDTAVLLSVDSSAGTSRTEKRALKKLRESDMISKLPEDCLGIVMSYLDFDTCFAVSRSSQSMYNRLTFEIVLGTAILGIPKEKEVVLQNDIGYRVRGASFNDPKWKHYRSLLYRDRARSLVEGITLGSIIVPTPQRMMALIHGRRCEMLGCESTTDLTSRVAPALAVGLFACGECMECWMHPRHRLNGMYRTLLGSQLETSYGVEGFWRAPYYTETGQRVGPAMTMMDADAIIRKQRTKVDVMKTVDETVRERVVEVSRALFARAQGYDDARDKFFDAKIQRRRNKKRDQIVECLKLRFADAPWLPVVLSRDSEGRFVQPLMVDIIERFIDRTFYSSDVFPKGTVTLKTTKIASAFDWMYNFGLHDASFLTDKPVRPVRERSTKKAKKAKTKNGTAASRGSTSLEKMPEEPGQQSTSDKPAVSMSLSPSSPGTKAAPKRPSLSSNTIARTWYSKWKKEIKTNDNQYLLNCISEMWMLKRLQNTEDKVRSIFVAILGSRGLCRKVIKECLVTHAKYAEESMSSQELNEKIEAVLAETALGKYDDGSHAPSKMLFIDKCDFVYRQLVHPGHAEVPDKGNKAAEVIVIDSGSSNDGGSTNHPHNNNNNDDLMSLSTIATFDASMP